MPEVYDSFEQQLRRIPETQLFQEKLGFPRPAEKKLRFSRPAVGPYHCRGGALDDRRPIIDK